MFTSITNRKSFGATYEWAVLSVLPMDADKERHGLRVSEVNQALGMPKEARTTATLLLKRMAAEGMIRRYEYKIGKRPFITYKRVMPLRKRERLARMLWGQCPPVPVVAVAQCPAAPPPPGGLKRHGSL